MDAATRESLIGLLGRAMSEISEEAYSGGWLSWTEHIVPELCRRAVATGSVQTCGRWMVEPEVARGLVYVADHIGCWANFDPGKNGWVPFQPFSIPADVLAMIDAG